jgi:PBP1b-binding outer membrane lipoprotein LpoB
MKAIASLIAVALLLVGLAGCASTPPPETTKVKCPACNYEFAPFAIGP